MNGLRHNAWRSPKMAFILQKKAPLLRNRQAILHTFVIRKCGKLQMEAGRWS